MNQRQCNKKIGIMGLLLGCFLGGNAHAYTSMGYELEFHYTKTVQKDFSYDHVFYRSPNFELKAEVVPRGAIELASSVIRSAADVPRHVMILQNAKQITLHTGKAPKIKSVSQMAQFLENDPTGVLKSSYKVDYVLDRDSADPNKKFAIIPIEHGVRIAWSPQLTLVGPAPEFVGEPLIIEDVAVDKRGSIEEIISYTYCVGGVEFAADNGRKEAKEYVPFLAKAQNIKEWIPLSAIEQACDIPNDNKTRAKWREGVETILGWSDGSIKEAITRDPERGNQPDFENDYLTYDKKGGDLMIEIRTARRLISIMTLDRRALQSYLQCMLEDQVNHGGCVTTATTPRRKTPSSSPKKKFTF